MDVDKKVRFSPGYFISFLIIGIPAFGWLVGFDFGGKTSVETMAIIFAKIGAFGGMTMFAWSLILSGRYKIFDWLFGGLDKMYGAHRFFGTFSVVLLVIHPLALTIARIPVSGTGALRMWLAFNSTALVLGMISLYGLIGFVVWSISAKKTKHETFVKVHRVLGFLFIIGALHAFMAGSVLQASVAVYWYMLILSGLATLTFVHYSLFSDILHPHYRYKISSVKNLPGGVWDIRLKPKQRIINFLPGQFVYLSFSSLPESGYHPFSIASGKRSSELQFFIKELGDLTESFKQLKAGQLVKIKGPYGGFTFDDKSHDKQLWIAGGIGITPFLSKARSFTYTKQWPAVELIYTTKNKYEAFAFRELDHIQTCCKPFNVTLIHETKFGRKSLHDLSEHFGGLEDYAIYLCGPPAMLAIYLKQAEELGIRDQVHFEEFSYN